MLANAKKIVIKIGSNTISNSKGFINEHFIKNLCEEVAFLKQKGKEVVIVTSGAKISGISAINKWSRKSDMNYKQALCAIGQVRLLNSYDKYFAEYGINIGQILLTMDDFLVDDRILNIRNTLFTLIDEGVVPIINENDTVCVKELKIGDNDTLAAHTAMIWNADLLIILSDIEGLYDKNPKEYVDAKLIEVVANIDDIDVDEGIANEFGTGGIKTKLDAARICNNYEIDMILASGKEEDVLLKLYENKLACTYFKSN
ncbi:glutamate 5-kinase [Candidatus Epulonipiscium viviparus]|uniref:glutamate 5-kinase n=1 Tax=Candidatus Epulonipiscium viviparus TaxID=420336 RepID=UPI0027381100|nr:glutamate 5-kinase [Candidatus Epulopiscium viviparus]